VPGHRPGTTEPTRARHLLARANALGYPIRWAYQGDDAPDVAVKNAMVRAFRKAGFQPEPVRSSLARIATDYSTNKKSDINLRQVGWCADWPSGITILPSLLTGPDVSSPLFGDFAQFSSAAVNARVRTIERLPLGRQPAAWSALEQRVETSQLPIIPLYYQRIAIAHGPRVHGANFNTTLMMPTYDDVWIG
jgi:peptide/nickel transport system substrate-binding protein